jgi:hypothetical protein
MRAWPLVLIATCLAFTAVGAESDFSKDTPSATVHEPASRFGFSAHLLSHQPQGDKERVILELTLRPMENVGPSRVEAALHRGRKFTTSEFTAGFQPTGRGKIRTVRRELLLNKGVDHTIAFTLETEDSTGATHREATHLRVNLDPSRQPDRRNGLNQYRGKPTGYVEP